jgi:Cu-Zn family superoxide dismutase
MKRLLPCRKTVALAVVTAVGSAPAFADAPAAGRAHAAQDHAGHAHATEAAPVSAVAVLGAASGSKVQGTARFTTKGDAVEVVVDIEGLTPNQQHAIHVHEFGDCTAPDAASAGSHYNPEGHPHALPAADTRHAGDLGNLQADAQGKAHYEITVRNCSIAGVNPILGRAVIVHAKPDDGGQPVGNAGGRIACGVIGIAKPPEKPANR